MKRLAIAIAVMAIAGVATSDEEPTDMALLEVGLGAMQIYMEQWPSDKEAQGYCATLQAKSFRMLGAALGEKISEMSKRCYLVGLDPADRVDFIRMWSCTKSHVIRMWNCMNSHALTTETTDQLNHLHRCTFTREFVPRPRPTSVALGR